MLRYRTAELKAGKGSVIAKQLVKTDRNGKLGGAVAPLANWATDTGNTLTRPAMEKIVGINRNAALPKFHGKTFAMRAKRETPEVNAKAPAFGRKAVLYATCFANYNNPGIGMAARKVAGELKSWIARGYDVIALVPSCALMLKFEWPLILPDDADVKLLSRATYDCSEYIVDIAKKEGLADGLTALQGGITLHMACHARAQNMGQKAAEMLRLLPETKITVIERCSGHGGSWGVEKGNFETALKVGKPVAKQAAKNATQFLASECPLAGMHIVQGVERLEGAAQDAAYAHHPIELFARAYGIVAA
jgi:glycerol-3-phosphate dehydrogenase subunit C